LFKDISKNTDYPPPNLLKIMKKILMRKIGVTQFKIYGQAHAMENTNLPSISYNLHLNPPTTKIFNSDIKKPD